MAIVSCSETESPPEDRVISQFEDRSLNIGYIHGSPVFLRNSAALAVQHINNAGGVLSQNFNIIYNNRGDTEESKAKAIVMMDEYNIQTIISTTSSRTLAILEETRPRQVLLISETATSPALTNANDNDLLFRTAPSDIHQGKVLAQMAFDIGIQSAVFVINAEDSYGSGLAAEFEKELSLLGSESISIVEIPDELRVGFDDYMPLVYDSQPDVVVLALVRTTVNSNFINETANLNFQGYYLFSDVAVNNTFTSNLADPSVLSQAFGVSPAKGLKQSVHHKFFAQSYLDNFSEEIQTFSSNTYDAVMVAALATEHAGKINNTGLPSGNMIGLSMREIMNPAGTEVGPSNISEAFSLIQQGREINYQGAYSNNDFNSAGDIVGTLVYDTFSFNTNTVNFELIEQIVIDVPLTPQILTLNPQ